MQFYDGGEMLKTVVRQRPGPVRKRRASIPGTLFELRFVSIPPEIDVAAIDYLSVALGQDLSGAVAARAGRRYTGSGSGSGFGKTTFRRSVVSIWMRTDRRRCAVPLWMARGHADYFERDGRRDVGAALP